MTPLPTPQRCRESAEVLKSLLAEHDFERCDACEHGALALTFLAECAEKFDEEKCREEFEKELRNRHWMMSFGRDERGYHVSGVEDFWQIWLAASRRYAVREAVLRELILDIYQVWTDERCGLNDVKNKIEAARAALGEGGERG